MHTHNGDGDPSIGRLFRRITTDSSHLIRQEINLAKTEIRETGEHLGQAAVKFGIALGVALPGVLALTAFFIIGLGDLMDNYWASALIVAVVLLGVGGWLAMRAMAALKQGVGIPETAETLKEDAQWAKQEAKEFTREITA